MVVVLVVVFLADFVAAKPCMHHCLHFCAPDKIVNLDPRSGYSPIPEGLQCKLGMLSRDRPQQRLHLPS